MGVSPVTPLGNQAGKGQPGPRRHGMRCRRPSSDLLPTHRLSTKVFPAPFSPHPPSFQAPDPYPTSFKPPSSYDEPCSLPNCLSSPPVFMKSGRPNPRLSQSKTSPENPAERAEEKALRDSNEAFQAQNTIRNFMETTSYYPTHCLSKP